jgi:hypothetical protein
VTGGTESSESVRFDVVVVGHLPVRPTWDCGYCGDEWPCKEVRESLTDPLRLDTVSVAVYMAGKLGEAARDLAHLDPDGLFARFIAWTQRAPLDGE